MSHAVLPRLQPFDEAEQVWNGFRPGPYRHPQAYRVYFMEASLAEATMAHDQREGPIERFLTARQTRSGLRSGIVTLEQLREPPYKGRRGVRAVLTVNATSR
jgi:hypothetical protein